MEGVTKIVLMIAHDTPHFLSYYFAEFVSVIPPQCHQLRSIVLSASHRPVTQSIDSCFNNITVDMMRKPDIRCDLEGPIEKVNALRGDINSAL